MWSLFEQTIQSFFGSKKLQKAQATRSTGYNCSHHQLKLITLFGAAICTTSLFNKHLHSQIYQAPQYIELTLLSL